MYTIPHSHIVPKFSKKTCHPYGNNRMIEWNITMIPIGRRVFFFFKETMILMIQIQFLRTRDSFPSFWFLGNKKWSLKDLEIFFYIWNSFNHAIIILMKEKDRILGIFRNEIRFLVSKKRFLSINSGLSR